MTSLDLSFNNITASGAEFIGEVNHKSKLTINRKKKKKDTAVPNFNF